MAESQSNPPGAGLAGIGSFDVIVVGAGFAGLYMLHRLREIGLSVQVLETGDGIGGTWYWNRYPGARCDLESVDYSYSFSPELEQEWVWTERYASQPEILRYIDFVADRFDLRRNIQLNTHVTEAAFDETTSRWSITTENGQHFSAQFLVAAMGALSAVKHPEVEGLDTFEGRWFHTGSWPCDGVDFAGRLVGVIGTGSSGVQSIPVIAEQAEHLTVFQRTPNFSAPARNHPLEPDTLSAVKAEYRQRRAKARVSSGGLPLDPPTLSALEVDPEERQRILEERWENSTLLSLRSSFTDVMTDSQANDFVASFARSKIRTMVKDPVIAEMLTPKGYPFGAKRPTLDTNYYETFNRKNVSLVDLRKTPIMEITEKGLRTSEMEYHFDTLVLATGFDSLTGPLLNVDIRGRRGLRLKERWASGPCSYLGIAVAGFPNFFIITGPQSPSVLSNMLVSIEQHVEWIADCINYLRSQNVASIEATLDAESDWGSHADEVANKTLYPLADSSYTGANVLGKPRFFLPYVGGVGVYRARCTEVAESGYQGFTLFRA